MTEAVASGSMPLRRLPPGQHGLPREHVRESQRQRLIAAATASLADHGYGRITTTQVAKLAGVSTSTLYKRFGDLWECLRVAYEAGADRLTKEIEGACMAAEGDRPERVEAGIVAALELLAAEPPLAHLLTTEPPSRAAALWAGRQRLAADLADLLRDARGAEGSSEREARLIGGALALVSTRTRAGKAERLGDLVPALSEFLLAS